MAYSRTRQQEPLAPWQEMAWFIILVVTLWGSWWVVAVLAFTQVVESRRLRRIKSERMEMLSMTPVIRSDSPTVDP